MLDEQVKMKNEQRKKQIELDYMNDTGASKSVPWSIMPEEARNPY